jgi:hypothetical protein
MFRSASHDNSSIFARGLIYVSRGKVEETTQTTFPQQENSMKILAIDLGKYNSVACLFDTTTNQSNFETFATQRGAFEQLLNQTKPDQIVMETSSITRLLAKVKKL